MTNVANVTRDAITRFQDASFGILLTRRQVEALAAVLVHVSDEDEGSELADLYATLREEGCESDALWSGVENGFVVVSRDGAR